MLGGVMLIGSSVSFGSLSFAATAGLADICPR